MLATQRLKRKAFTLAELLVSLAVLGMTATFIIPKIFNGQDDSKKKAIFKDTIAVITSARDDYLSKYPTPALVQFGVGHWYFDYYASIIDNAKNCSANGQGLIANCGATGWYFAPLPGSSSDMRGLILKSGAFLGFAWAGGADGGVQQKFLIDWNGVNGPNQIGDDQLVLLTCLGSLCSSTFKDRTVPETGWGGAVDGDNRNLYEWIFK